MDRAIELLEEQQRKVKERSAPWLVAEQLKDICRREPHSAKILAQDLENASMSITEAEKKIKAFAVRDPAQRGSSPAACCPGRLTPSCGSSTVLAPLGTRPRKAALRRSSIWRISCEVRYGQRLEESRGEIAGRAPQ